MVLRGKAGTGAPDRELLANGPLGKVVRLALIANYRPPAATIRVRHPGARRLGAGRPKLQGR